MPKSWVVREGAEKPDLVRGADPRLPYTPGVDLEDRREEPQVPRPHSFGAPEAVLLQLSFPLAAGCGPGRAGAEQVPGSRSALGARGVGEGEA